MSEILTNKIIIERKNCYNSFCKLEKYIPIFSQSWWLDIACGHDHWDVILVRNDGDIIASFPFYQDKLRYNLKIITMPVLTQKMGIYIKYPENLSSSSKLTLEKKIYTEIIDKLPKFDYFNVTLDHKYLNWLPFYWRGFKQTTQYTYIVEDLSNMDLVLKNFGKGKKSDIKKAADQLSIRFDMSPQLFIDFYNKSLKKQNKELSYSETLFIKLCSEAISRKQGEIICAIDREENIHGAIFYVWDNECIYNLVTAFDPDFRSSGASSYLFFQIMRKFSTHNLKFDFEGSMLENIEQSYSRFGTVQKMYFRVYKENSKKYKLIRGLKELLEVLRQ